MKNILAIFAIVFLVWPSTILAGSHACGKSRSILYPCWEKRSSVILYPCVKAKTILYPCPPRHRTAEAPPNVVVMPAPVRIDYDRNEKKTAHAKPIPKPKKKKVKTLYAGDCLKELRRLSAENRKIAEEIGALRERDRANQAWFDNYREQYKKYDGWRGLSKPRF